MKISIKDGVKKMADAMVHDGINFDKQWHELRNKVDVILLSNNISKTDKDKSDIRKLDSMSHEERQQYICNNWGPMYLDRCMPILIQINILEKSRVK